MTNPAGAPAAKAAEIKESPARAAIRRDLQNLADYYADLIFVRDEAVHYESVLERYFPNLNWDRLLNLYGESPDDWTHIIAGYMEMLTPEELEPPEPPAAAAKPPLRCLGQAPDLFSGELRPVYNREPEPGEERPA